ncbi:MAG TPA: hypothetical protein VGL89_18010, partial [Candidatus Koribacter sp.]
MRLRLGVLCIALCLLFGPAAATGQNESAHRNLGSAYLALDHWAYPALERAIAKGALPAQFMGLRPWTRMAIAELLEERRRNPLQFSQDD